MSEGLEVGRQDPDVPKENGEHTGQNGHHLKSL